jgi:hypothetical protein
VVYLDTNTGRIRAWVDAVELHGLSTGPMPAESAATFDDYPAFVSYLVESYAVPFSSRTDTPGASTRTP